MKRHFRLLWICSNKTLGKHLSLRVNDSCGGLMFSAFAICWQDKELSGLQVTGQYWQCHCWCSIWRKVWKIKWLQTELQNLNFFPLSPSQLWTYWAVFSNRENRNLTWKASVCSFLEGLQFRSTLGKGFNVNLHPKNIRRYWCEHPECLGFKKMFGHIFRQIIEPGGKKLLKAH